MGFSTSPPPLHTVSPQIGTLGTSGSQILWRVNKKRRGDGNSSTRQQRWLWHMQQLKSLLNILKKKENRPTLLDNCVTTNRERRVLQRGRRRQSFYRYSSPGSSVWTPPQDQHCILTVCQLIEPLSCVLLWAAYGSFCGKCQTVSESAVAGAWAWHIL